MAVPEPADQIELSNSAIARPLATDMREELLAIMREIFERNAPHPGTTWAKHQKGGRTLKAHHERAGETAS